MYLATSIKVPLAIRFVYATLCKNMFSHQYNLVPTGSPLFVSGYDAGIDCWDVYIICSTF